MAKVSRLFLYIQLTLRNFKDTEELLYKLIKAVCCITKHYGFSLTQNLLGHIHFKVNVGDWLLKIISKF